MARPSSETSPLAELVEQAFDYRGDVTVVTRDGRGRVGYVYNRNRDVPTPFIQMLSAEGGDAETIPYTDIVSVAFTGRDTAAGNSYAAWRNRKEAERAGPSAPPVRSSSADG
jgi:hypothetical protein